MIILDSLLIGGIRFVLDKVASAVDEEMNDEGRAARGAARRPDARTSWARSDEEEFARARGRHPGPPARDPRARGRGEASGAVSLGLRRLRGWTSPSARDRGRVAKPASSASSAAKAASARPPAPRPPPWPLPKPAPAGACWPSPPTRPTPWATPSGSPLRRAHSLQNPARHPARRRARRGRGPRPLARERRRDPARGRRARAPTWTRRTWTLPRPLPARGRRAGRPAGARPPGPGDAERRGGGGHRAHRPHPAPAGDARGLLRASRRVLDRLQERHRILAERFGGGAGRPDLPTS